VHAALGARRNASAADDAPWLLYVAGDLPPLYQLLRRHPTLGAHVVSAEGALGHVSENVVCSSTQRSQRARVCTASGWDPGGAWTRAMVDAWMLGAVDVLVRFGSTSFINVIRGRIAWRLPEIELAGAWQPEGNWTLHTQYMKVVHSMVDALSRELTAEEEDETAVGGAAARRLT
jgi:hypothetical protein